MTDSPTKIMWEKADHESRAYLQTDPTTMTGKKYLLTVDNGIREASIILNQGDLLDIFQAIDEDMDLV